MAYDHDDQLLDSIAVRHARVIQSFMFGDQRRRERWRNRLTALLVSIALTALICAGCVGYSFVMTLLRKDQVRTGQQNIGSVSWPTPPPPPTGRPR